MVCDNMSLGEFFSGVSKALPSFEMSGTTRLSTQCHMLEYLKFLTAVL
jgi:hypothetical protein